ncbi:hypothetical protein [Latilactobacillus graminis]|uniref:Uncharacterized protein n=2 Tax=Latilactobacillus graminis TaxID=60519 RepID=A0AA89L4M2_9LACO|nr:hypothetical protein [Latilactobacillus graminis]KRM24013.1 hypothetical protein FC90_GL001255 [Latilactobacillus graminis DSM 20719]QFP79823.1 hypothetical protein LG542_06005 [Latilactobacillus graminis]
MKHLWLIISVGLSCLLLLTSPHWFNRDSHASKSHSEKIVHFEVVHHSSIHRSTNSDDAERQLNKFNQRCENFFNHLTLPSETFYVVAGFLGFTIFILVLEPLLALLLTTPQKPQSKKKESPNSSKRQIPSFKRHLLD